MTLTVGSLFSGIGGFDLGCERAGMRVAWQSEIDRAASAVLRRHWPHVPNLGDVRHVGRESGTPPVDIICGGFPCQDLSVAGRRAGLAGERSGLWHEFHHIVASLRPRWVVVENVPGLLSSNGGRDFAVVLRGLVECGYGVSWRVLDAQYFGVPQRRRRVFIVGSLGDGRSAQVLFERESGPGDTEPRRAAGEVVAGTLTGGAAGGRGHGKPNGSDRRELVAIATIKGAAIGRALQNGPQRGETLTDGTCFTLNTIERHAVAFQSRYYTRDNRPGGAPDELADLTNAHKAGDSATVVAYGIYDDPTPKIGENIMPALRSPSGGGANQFVAGSFGVRRLTPVECERLQGFPDGWTAGESDSARYRILGNAVCVNVAEWIARRIAGVGPRQG